MSFTFLATPNRVIIQVLSCHSFEVSCAFTILFADVKPPRHPLWSQQENSYFETDIKGA